LADRGAGGDFSDDVGGQIAGNLLAEGCDDMCPSCQIMTVNHDI
jgi:hypothetical protein